MLLLSTFCLYCWKVGHPFHKGKKPTNFTNYMECVYAGVSNHLWSLHCWCPLLEGQPQNLSLFWPHPFHFPPSLRPPVQPGWLLTALRIPWENPGLSAFSPLLPVLQIFPYFSAYLSLVSFLSPCWNVILSLRQPCGSMAPWEAHCEVIKENTHAIWICKCTHPWDSWSLYSSLSFIIF